ncbi:cardiolipin synthetase 2 [Fulvimarina manganoxydans]|uniref:Cardiolipin synthase n=1 Tax=Fulvimarina manganoxydans TaxID=937218 RepID=A0A1W2B059_9HYPH|nr:cardiolipin synthase [Fulvimarina manganoxydans]SMC66102.1 cardiolipin synthetase 2 [Fulvimarina manganoxydans]
MDFFNSDMVHTGFKIAGWAIVFGGLVYIPFRRSPTAAQAWILLFFFLPWVALPLYLVFGNARHPKWRRERITRLPAILERTIAEISHRSPTGVDVLKTRHRITARLVERIGHLPPVHGNEIDLDGDYNRVVDRIAADIDRAEHHAHLCFYILQDDEAGNRVLRALERASARGVKCRLLVDAVGSSIDRHRIRRRMKKAGVEMHLILPWRFLNGATRLDLRNHRKIVVIDGKIGWVGSQNMHRIEYEPKTFYRELMARVTGPVVLELQAIFVGDWFLETEEDIGSADILPHETTREAAVGSGTLLQVMPTGPDFPDTGVDVLFTDLIHTARRKIALATPYFVPNEELLNALSTAVAKGVDVDLFLTGTTNSLLIDLAQSSYYEDLLEAGVKVYLYRERFLHAKHLSIDEDIGIIGSSNMDRRSFELNSEVTLVAYDKAVVDKLRTIERDYRSKSRRLSLEDWRQRGLTRQIAENATRLISPLL